MLSHIDSTTLMVAFIALVGIALVFGAILNAIVRENGFGPVGNTVLFGAGFAGSAYLAGLCGVAVADLRLTVAWGMGGAFGLFAVLALAKAGVARF